MATRPNKGTVVPRQTGPATNQPRSSHPLAPTKTTKSRSPVRTGEWRPDSGFVSPYGLRITMRKEPGVTKGDVLRVPMRFQAPLLDDFGRPYEYNWSTYDTLRVGQKSRPMGRQLLQLQLDTLLLDDAAADGTTGTVVWNGSADPIKWLDELKWIMGYTPGSQPEPFRLVIAQPAFWGASPLVNMIATMTALQPTQKPDEAGSEYLSITFLEFPEDEDVKRKQRPQSHGATRWKLHPGDTLYEIAKKSHFHQASSWRMIAKANGISGVSPSSANDLATWAKKHHKTELKIPPKGRGSKSSSGGAGL